MDSLPRGVPKFLLSFLPMSTNTEIAQQLNIKRPLCILIAVNDIQNVHEYSELYYKIKYDLRIDNNIILRNVSPAHFIETYGRTHTMKFTKILTDQAYPGLTPMLAPDGEIHEVPYSSM